MSDFLKDPLWTEMARVHPGSPVRHALSQATFSTYDLSLNLLTFIGGKLHWRVRILGLPLSLSAPGYTYEAEAGRQAILAWVKAQKGLTLILNAGADFEEDLIPMTTLPTLHFENRFQSVAAYYNSLRAHYRYRFRKAKTCFEGVTSKSNPDFDPALYRLYEAVYERSDFPLEKCTPDYFKTLSADIEAFYVNDRPIGFYQYVVLGETLHFIFCGLDYAVLKTYDTYYNILLHLLEKGITLGVKSIDFGQTTEDIKQKLGAVPVEKMIYLHHHNRFMRWLLKHLAPFGSYKAPATQYHVYKRKPKADHDEHDEMQRGHDGHNVLSIEKSD